MSMSCTRSGVAVLVVALLIGTNLGFVAYPAQTGAGKAFGNDTPLAPATDARATSGLRWDFRVGKPLYGELTTDTKQTMQVMGTEITQNQKQTFIFSWTPQEQKNGNWILKQKIEGVKMDIEIGGNKITFDSTKDTGTSNPLSDFFKALVGSEFTITLNPKLEVTDIKGRQNFVNKLIQANPQMEPLLKQILSERALKQMTDSTFAILKTGDKGPEPVKKGDRWTRKSELDMGPVGKYRTTYRYTYDGKEGKLDRIKVDTSLTYQAPGKDSPGGLPFQIKKADLTSKDGTGTLWFDRHKGRLDHGELRLRLSGKLAIEIGGMTTEVELHQEQRTTIRFQDSNPVNGK